MLGVASVALRAAGCAWPKPAADPISRWEFDETSSAEGVFEDRGPAHVLMVHRRDLGGPDDRLAGRGRSAAPRLTPTAPPTRRFPPTSRRTTSPR